MFGHSENIKIDHRPFNYSALSGIVPEFQTWKKLYLDAEKIPPRDRTGLTADATIDHSRIMEANYLK
jgi:hypothetical protein